ncbi:MAG: IclR family transcriptional regulator [Anaerolineales bacterium]
MNCANAQATLRGRTIPHRRLESIVLEGQSSTSTTVAKAFAILRALAAEAREGMTLSEVCTRVGMSRSTTHRYLTTLEKLDVAERDGGDRFHLGPQLIGLAGSYLANSDLRTESVPVLQELASETQETIHLAVPSGNEVVYIDKVDSRQAIQMYSYIGARLPMHSTALGKSILAHLGAEQTESLISATLSRRTPHTITTAEALRRELELVKAQGFAVDDEENEVGVSCVGAPIFDYTQRVIGAVSVSGPTNRMTRERAAQLGPVVKTAAAHISRRVGGSPPV